MNETTVAIVLELEVAGDTVSGRATGPAGESLEFVGWLGLVSAIDSFLTATDEAGCNGRSAATRTAGDGLTGFSGVAERVIVDTTKREGEMP